MIGNQAYSHQSEGVVSPRSLRSAFLNVSVSGSDITITVTGFKSAHKNQGENFLRSPNQIFLLLHWRKLRHSPWISRYNLINWFVSGFLDKSMAFPTLELGMGPAFL